MSRATYDRRNTDKKQKTQRMLLELAENENMMACSVYEKISKVVVGAKREWRKNKRFVEETLDEVSEFKDSEYPPDNANLVPLTEQNAKIAKYFAWYRIHAFFEKKYSVFNEIKLKNQIIRNRGYVYIIDALNTISTQPGLVLRLFERKKTHREGIYAIWLNIDGQWQQEIIDDHIPIISDHKDKNQFFFTNPNPKQAEIWYMLLEKAMAKAYGGYKNLFHGFENYAVRDLTGAPHSIYDIPPVPLGKAIRQREVDHMNDFWEKLFKNLGKGYIMSIVPRLPTQTEKIANRNLEIFNKNCYMSNGLYSGHNYAIVTIKEVIDSLGNVNRIVKLRNPFINEIWQGDWAHNSSLWTSELKKKLNYDPEKNGYGDFWISIRDIMGYFEILNIYKTIPEFTYTSIDIPSEDRRTVRTFIKVIVPETGKYTFSVDQKDIRSYQKKELTYCPVKLSLGKIEKDNFKLLSHTSSKKLRNTYIRKLIEKGDYYLLVEKSNPDLNISLAQKEPEEFEDLNSFCVSAYGPKTCGLEKIKDTRKNYAVYDYVCYFGWKWYSQQRIGQKVSEFKVNFYDGSWNQMSLYLLNIPDLIIYAFKNDHDFGVELTTKIAGLPGREILGPEGKKSYDQVFSMNAGETDVFLFRNTRDDNTILTKENNKFQLKSVVGIKYIGTKENPPTFGQFYEFLRKIQSKIRRTEIEKDPSIKSRVGVFDMLKGKVKIKKKHEDVNQVKVKKMTRPMRLEDYEDLVDAQDLIQRERSLADENKRIRAKSQPSKYKPGEKIVERVRLEEFLKQNDPGKLADIKKSVQPETLEALKQEAQKEESIQNTLPAEPSRPISRRSHVSAQRKSHIPQQMPPQQKEKVQIDHQSNLKSLEKYINSVTQIDDNKLAKVLTLQKSELLSIEDDELKQLLKYFGIQAFITIYQVDETFLHQIVQKLEGNGILEKTEFVSRAQRQPVSSQNRGGVDQNTLLGATQAVDRSKISKSLGRVEVERTPRESQKAYQDRYVVEYPDQLKQVDTGIQDPLLLQQKKNLSEMILNQKQRNEMMRPSQKSRFGDDSRYDKSINGGMSRISNSSNRQISTKPSNRVTPSVGRKENMMDNRTFAESQISNKIRQRLDEIRGIKERLSQQVSNISNQHSQKGSPNQKRGLKYQILNQNSYQGAENSYQSKPQRMENETLRAPSLGNSNVAMVPNDVARANFSKRTASDILNSSGYTGHQTSKSGERISHYDNGQDKSNRKQELQKRIEQKRKERHEYGFPGSEAAQNNEMSRSQGPGMDPKLMQSLEAEKLKQLQEQEELLRMIELHKKNEAQRQEEQKKQEEELRLAQVEKQKLEAMKRSREVQNNHNMVIDQERQRKEALMKEQEKQSAIYREQERQRLERQEHEEEEKRLQMEIERRNNQIKQEELKIMEKIKRENEQIKQQHEVQMSRIKQKEERRRQEMMAKHSRFASPNVSNLRQQQPRLSEMKKPQSYKARKPPGRKTLGDPSTSQIQAQEQIGRIQTQPAENTYRPPSRNGRPSYSRKRRPSYTNKIPQLEHYDPTVERFNRLKKTLQQKRMIAENNFDSLNRNSNAPVRSVEPLSRMNTGNSSRSMHFGEHSRPQTGTSISNHGFTQRPNTATSNNFVDKAQMDRIKKVLKRSNYNRGHQQQFHQERNSQISMQGLPPNTTRNPQLSPAPAMKESHYVPGSGQGRAPFRNKKARNTTNPALYSRNEPKPNNPHMSGYKTSRRERVAGRVGDLNNLNRSNYQNLMATPNNNFVKSNHQTAPRQPNRNIPFSNRINGLVSPDMKRSQMAEMKRSKMAEQGQNVQVIPINNQAISMNALTERSASSRHLGYMHGGNPTQGNIQMQPQQNQHMNLKQSRYLQNQSPVQQTPQQQFQPQQPQFQPQQQQAQFQPQQQQFQSQPQFQPQQQQSQPQFQQPTQNMRASSDFHQQSPFQNVNNMQYFAPPPEQQPAQNYSNQGQMSLQTSQQPFSMGQQHQQQFNSMNNFNQSTSNNFRPRSPGPGPAGFNSNMNGQRDSIAKKKLAYGNQERPKSSRGGGFLGGLFG